MHRAQSAIASTIPSVRTLQPIHFGVVYPPDWEAKVKDGPELADVGAALVDSDGAVAVGRVERVEAGRVDEEGRVAVDGGAAGADLQAADAEAGGAGARRRAATLHALGHRVARARHVGHLARAQRVGEAHDREQVKPWSTPPPKEKQQPNTK